MSLIKTHLLEDQRQKEALEEAKLLLLEYIMFDSLTPMLHSDSLSKPYS